MFFKRTAMSGGYNAVGKQKTNSDIRSDWRLFICFLLFSLYVSAISQQIMHQITIHGPSFTIYATYNIHNKFSKTSKISNSTNYSNANYCV